MNRVLCFSLYTCINGDSRWKGQCRSVANAGLFKQLEPSDSFTDRSPRGPIDADSKSLAINVAFFIDESTISAGRGAVHKNEFRSRFFLVLTSLPSQPPFVAIRDRQVNPLGVASITLPCCNYRVTGRYANRHAHS